MSSFPLGLFSSLPCLPAQAIRGTENLLHHHSGDDRKPICVLWVFIGLPWISFSCWSLALFLFISAYVAWTLFSGHRWCTQLFLLLSIGLIVLPQPCSFASAKSCLRDGYLHLLTEGLPCLIHSRVGSSFLRNGSPLRECRWLWRLSEAEVTKTLCILLSLGPWPEA